MTAITDFSPDWLKLIREADAISAAGGDGYQIDLGSPTWAAIRLALGREAERRIGELTGNLEQAESSYVRGYLAALLEIYTIPNRQRHLMQDAEGIY